MNLGLLEACIVAFPFVFLSASVRLVPELSDRDWLSLAARWLAFAALVSFLWVAWGIDLLWMGGLGASVDNTVGEQFQRYLCLFGCGGFFAVAGYPLTIQVIHGALSGGERRAVFWRMLVIGWTGIAVMGYYVLKFAR